MRTTLRTGQEIVLLGSRNGSFQGPLPPASPCVMIAPRLKRRSTVAQNARHGSRSRVIPRTRFSRRRLMPAPVLRGSRLITLIPPRPESIPALLGLFHQVFGLVEGLRWLPRSELVEAIARDDSADRFIGGSVDRKAKILTLLRGDITTLLAPFRLFSRSGDGTALDFARLRLTDYGRTIALGDYEASADAVLYELDPDYRRGLNKRRCLDDRTFGASLRRLRKQRRLKRSDFAPISSKEIARVERNEIRKPHAKTLEIIAHRLGVRPQEITGY